MIQARLGVLQNPQRPGAALVTTCVSTGTHMHLQGLTWYSLADLTSRFCEAGDNYTITFLSPPNWDVLVRRLYFLKSQQREVKPSGHIAHRTAPKPAVLWATIRRELSLSLPTGNRKSLAFQHSNPMLHTQLWLLLLLKLRKKMYFQQETAPPPLPDFPCDPYFTS